MRRRPASRIGSKRAPAWHAIGPTSDLPRPRRRLPWLSIHHPMPRQVQRLLICQHLRLPPHSASPHAQPRAVSSFSRTLPAPSVRQCPYGISKGGAIQEAALFRPAACAGEWCTHGSLAAASTSPTTHSLELSSLAVPAKLASSSTPSVRRRTGRHHQPRKHACQSQAHRRRRQAHRRRRSHCRMGLRMAIHRRWPWSGAASGGSSVPLVFSTLKFQCLGSLLVARAPRY